MMIDVLAAAGLTAMAQVDLGTRLNRHQPLPALGAMSFEVVQRDRDPADPRGQAVARPSCRPPTCGRPALRRECASSGRRSSWSSGPPMAKSLAGRVMALRGVYADLDGTMLGRGASLVRDAEGNFSSLAVRGLEAVSPRGRGGRDQVRAPQGAGERGRTPDRPALLHIRDGRRVGRRRRGGVPDRRFDAARRPDRPRPDRAVRGAGPAAGDLPGPDRVPRRPGTPIAFLASVPRKRRPGGVDGCSQSTGTRTCDWSTTASPSGAPRAAGRHRAHLSPDPGAAGKANAVADPHAPPRLEPAECIAVGDSRGDLEVADVVGRFFLVANGPRARSRRPRRDRDGRT